MNAEQPVQEEAKKSLYRSLRANVLPVKPEDGMIVRFLKNTGFGIFLVMSSVVGALIAVAVAFAA